MQKTQNKLIEEMNKLFSKKHQPFGKGKFYQSYEPLNIDGMRKTKLRFKKYKLNEFISRKSTVLDIASNCGFFANYICPYVRFVHGFDSEPELVEISNLLASYLNNNAKFEINTFEKFKTSLKYNVVLSLAIHKWLSISTTDFCDKLLSLLFNNGYLVIESHEISKRKNDKEYPKICIILSQNLTKIYEGKIKDDGVVKRKFSIWQKTIN